MCRKELFILNYKFSHFNHIKNHLFLYKYSVWFHMYHCHQYLLKLLLYVCQFCKSKLCYNHQVKQKKICLYLNLSDIIFRMKLTARLYRWGFVRDIDKNLYINNTEYTEEMSGENWLPLENILK